MKLIACVIPAFLLAGVTAHVPAFRNGMWQMVPGQSSSFGDFNRFRSFGPVGDMWRFGFGFPGQFPGQLQVPWNGNNMWWDTGLPQIPQIHPNNGAQWTNNGNGNQQIPITDPQAQWRLLQGTGANTNTNPAFNDPSSQTTLNTWAVQPGNPGLGSGVGNQFPIVPNNNGIVNAFAPLQGTANVAGSPWNNQFQGFPNTGVQGFPNNGMAFADNVNSVGKKK